MAEAVKTVKTEEKDAQQAEHILYECAYLLDGNIAEEKATEVAASLRGAIEKMKSIIVEETQPKLRKLAYPVEKRESGFFGWIKFLAQASDIAEIEKQAKRMPEVIRVLIVQSFREELMEHRTRARKKVVTEEEKGRIEEIDKKLEEILGD